MLNNFDNFADFYILQFFMKFTFFIIFIFFLLFWQCPSQLVPQVNWYPWAPVNCSPVSWSCVISFLIIKRLLQEHSRRLHPVLLLELPSADNKANQDAADFLIQQASWTIQIKPIYIFKMELSIKTMEKAAFHTFVKQYLVQASRVTPSPFERHDNYQELQMRVRNWQKTTDSEICSSQIL